MPQARRDDPRLDLLRRWLEQGLGWHDLWLEPASADASFRRYFRVGASDHDTVVAMDAPPGQEDVEPYLRVAGMLEAIGGRVYKRYRIYERPV